MRFDSYEGEWHKRICSWTKGVPVEQEALNHLRATAMLPIIHRHIAVMPDVRCGNWFPVGGVIPTDKALIPAAVGSDIGCGVSATRINADYYRLMGARSRIKSRIASLVPLGAGSGAQFTSENYRYTVGNNNEELLQDVRRLIADHDDLSITEQTALYQLGTLGGGDHFIEISVDDEEKIWVLVHSGSRSLGRAIRDYYYHETAKDMQRHSRTVPSRNLSYITEGTKLFGEYLVALNVAQAYAAANRAALTHAAISAVTRYAAGTVNNFEPSVVYSTHNCVTREHHYGKDVWVTRNGAIRAKRGDRGIVTGSMGAPSFVVRGKGNETSFHSCSNSAGRTMSRMEAQETISTMSHVAYMRETGVAMGIGGSIYSDPRVYKDIFSVMNAQSDLVDIEFTLRPVLNIKG